MDTLFKPFLESLYDSDPTTVGAIMEAYDTIFEGFEYVRDAKKFSNDIFNALMDVTEEDFINGYAGEDNEVNRSVGIKGPVVVLNSNSITSKMPNYSPLCVLFTHARTSGKYWKVEAGMLADLNRPILIFFRGNPHGITPNRLYRMFKTQVSENQDNITHELVHLYDKMTRGQIGLKNKYSGRKSQQQFRKLASDNAEYMQDPEQAKNITPEIIQYYNSPSELNARLVSAIDSAITEGHISSWDEFYKYVMDHLQIRMKSTLAHTNPTRFSDENYKKIVRNLHKVYSNLMNL